MPENLNRQVCVCVWGGGGVGGGERGKIPCPGCEQTSLRSLHLCQKTWQTPLQKTIYHLIDLPIKQSFEYS